MDDGARVWLFNTKHPDGFYNPKADITGKGDGVTVDLSGEAAPGENRIVVAQFDWSGGFDHIRGIHIKADGNEIKPTPRENSHCFRFRWGSAH